MHRRAAKAISLIAETWCNNTLHCARGKTAKKGALERFKTATLLVHRVDYFASSHRFEKSQL
jgi:hypothetical protein